MNSVAINQGTTVTVKEQKLTLPGWYDWQQFKAIKTLIKQQPGVKVSYVDGVIELMTLGEEHETIKSIIAILLGIYFWQKGIDFTPVGSATRESEEQEVSFEPDESYYIGEKKERPDLAIEVNITSGSVKKLEKYKRFQIQEVWLWQDKKFSLYSLQNNEYKQVFKSQLLPNLNFKLLEDCVLMDSKLQAIKIFTESIQENNQK